MASISTTPRVPLPTPISSSHQLDPSPGRFHPTHRRLGGAVLVRCSSRGSDADGGGEHRRGWDALFHDAFQGAVRRWSDYVSNYWTSPSAAKKAVLGKGLESSHKEDVRGVDEEEEREVEDENGKWSWERWKRHFALIEESECLVDELELQLRAAVYREDYRSAHKLKLAISATAKNDTVGRAISDLNRAIQEERYHDAAYIRDHAGAGLDRCTGTLIGASCHRSGSDGLYVLDYLCSLPPVFYLY